MQGTGTRGHSLGCEEARAGQSLRTHAQFPDHFPGTVASFPSLECQPSAQAPETAPCAAPRKVRGRAARTSARLKKSRPLLRSMRRHTEYDLGAGPSTGLCHAHHHRHYCVRFYNSLVGRNTVKTKQGDVTITSELGILTSRKGTRPPKKICPHISPLLPQAGTNRSRPRLTALCRSHTHADPSCVMTTGLWMTLCSFCGRGR